MSAAAPPKRARTARQQRADQGVIDVRIVGYDPRLEDGVGDTGGKPPPVEPPEERRNGYRGGHEMNWWGAFLAGLAALCFLLLAISFERRWRREKEGH